MEDTKEILIEIYKQESENLRAFEEILWKTHLTSLSAIFVILYHLRISMESIYPSDISLAYVFIIIFGIGMIILSFGLDSKHYRRMVRLSRIARALELDKKGYIPHL